MLSLTRAACDLLLSIYNIPSSKYDSILEN